MSAIVTVPVLLAPVAFLDTVYFTVLFPVTLLPEVIVIHGTLLLTVPLQLPDEEVTLTLPLPPTLLNVAEVGDMLKVHAGAEVNVAATVFAEFMLVIVQTDFADKPAIVSQLPDQVTVDPLVAAAVSVIIVP